MSRQCVTRKYRPPGDVYGGEAAATLNCKHGPGTVRDLMRPGANGVIHIAILMEVRSRVRARVLCNGAPRCDPPRPDRPGWKMRALRTFRETLPLKCCRLVRCRSGWDYSKLHNSRSIQTWNRRGLIRRCLAP